MSGRRWRGPLLTFASLLVRVVRTSTEDVNRRTATRVDIERYGKIEVGGRSRQIVVRNVSERGAVLIDAMPDIALNSAVVLTVDGLGASLAGVVARNDAGGTLLNLELTDALRKLIGSLLDGQRAA